MIGGINMADAPAGIEPDVPDPSRLLRRGDGVGGDLLLRRGIRDLQGKRRVTEQDVAARFVSDTQCLADELGTKPGAVDVEVSRELAICLRCDTGNGAVIV